MKVRRGRTSLLPPPRGDRCHALLRQDGPGDGWAGQREPHRQGGAQHLDHGVDGAPGTGLLADPTRARGAGHGDLPAALRRRLGDEAVVFCLPVVCSSS